MLSFWQNNIKCYSNTSIIELYIRVSTIIFISLPNIIQFLSMFGIGYAALFMASFLAATIIPFSSEAVLSASIYGGYNTILCLVFATAGNWLGGLTSYFLGYFGKQSLIDKYLKIKPQKIERFKIKIKGNEQWIAFFCWTPFIGDVLALALGLLRVNIINVAFGMLVGKATRYIVWAYFTLWAINY